MTANKNNPIPSHWLVAVALAVLVPLVAGFNGRMTTLQQMREEERQLAQAIADEQARRVELEDMHAYVQSDAYVEHWARVEARMAQPGEVAVVPVLQGNTGSQVVTDQPVRQPDRPSDQSPLEQWWTVFFDPSPSASDIFGQEALSP